MQIVAIKVSRTPEKVYIKLSNGLFIPFFLDDVVTLSLKKGNEIDDIKLTEILDFSLLYISKNYALRQLAISPKTKKILTDKLNLYLKHTVSRYKYPENFVDIKNTINKTLDYIDKKNLINDLSYTEFFIKKNKNKSKREICYLLERQGINTRNIPPELFETNSEKEKIKSFLNKKNIQKKDLLDYNYKNKLIASLYRKGFSLAEIKGVIDDIANSS